MANLDKLNKKTATQLQVWPSAGEWHSGDVSDLFSYFCVCLALPAFCHRRIAKSRANVSCNVMTKLRIRILFLILLFFAFNKIQASPQLPDYIIYKNDTIPTYNLLVEQYLQKLNPDEEKLFGLSFRNSLEGLGTSFNCWRGYQAIYRIENDSLFVEAIIDCHSIKNIDINKSRENLKLLFGNKVKNNRVFTDWFIGDISFPTKHNNNEIIRWDGVFENIFFYETLLNIKKGKVIKEKNIENYTDYTDRINRKKDDVLSNVIFEKLKFYKWTKLDEFDCSETYKIRINKKGEIDLIEMALTNQEIKDFYEKNEAKHCINSLKKALKDLRFDILKRRGKPIDEIIYIELWFEEDGTIENWTN